MLKATDSRAPLWKVAGIAFLAMCAADVISTAMTIFEAHYQAVPAGTLDVFGYIAGLICSAAALDSIIKDGWRTKRSLVIIAAVTVANFAGTVGGVYLTRALTR